MCVRMSEQGRKNLWDKNSEQGKYHPEYGHYPIPSYKLKAGETGKKWVDDYVPMPNTYLNLAETAKGAEPVDPKQYVQDVQNKRSTSLSSNDSARG